MARSIRMSNAVDVSESGSLAQFVPVSRQRRTPNATRTAYKSQVAHPEAKPAL